MKKEKRSILLKKIFLSRIHPKKGIELLEAWRNTDTKGWALEIAGSGESSYMLKHRAEDKKPAVCRSTYGKQVGFFRSADLMVLPSHSENFGLW
jgi:glycosyltransferase involved in cell wall biosynthesis